MCGNVMIAHDGRYPSGPDAELDSMDQIHYVDSCMMIIIFEN